MNNFLPKVFSKEGLLDMIEVSSSIEFRPGALGLETSYASQSYATNDSYSISITTPPPPRRVRHDTHDVSHALILFFPLILFQFYH